MTAYSNAIFRTG